MKYFSIADWYLVPFYLLVVFYFAKSISKRRIETQPEYKYFIPGLSAKIFGGIAFALFYALYYQGGDTLNYYNDGICYNKLLFSNPGGFLKVFSEGTNQYNYHYFSYETGLPMYWKETYTTNVVRISFFASLIGFRSFLVASIIFAVISFHGLWRLYQVFILEFPQLQKQMAISILFIPSVIFWGSGILKDTVTMSSVGYFVASFYYIFILRKRILVNILIFCLSIYLIISIRPYLFIALAPGALIWMIDSYISKIKGSFIRYAATPLFLSIAVGFAFLMLSSMSNQLGDYSLDKVLDKAVITQSDLKRDFYQGNSFDIGELEATIPSLLSHAHLAINAALFRPYLWESKNIAMFISGVENLFFLLFSIFILFKLRVFGLFRNFFRHHLLTFSLIFSLFFAFSVGVTTSNFGSMVRYRIHLIPFYMSSLFILRQVYTEAKNKNEIHFADESLHPVPS